MKTAKEILARIKNRDRKLQERHERRMSFWQKHLPTVVFIVIIVGLCFLAIAHFKGIWP